jgi:hypothetical protein
MMRSAIVILFVLTAAIASAQRMPDAPSSADRVLEVAAVASIGLDAYATNMNWTQPDAKHGEVNPIARPFVANGTGPLTTYFAFSAAGFVYAHHKWARHNRRLALAFDLAVLGTEAYWSGYSFAHHGR